MGQSLASFYVGLRGIYWQKWNVVFIAMFS